MNWTRKKTHKKILLTVLLVLGIILIGGGVWLKYNSAHYTSLDRNQPVVNIPQSEAVVYEQALYTMQGENDELYIFNDGSLLYIQEDGLRFPSPEHPAIRTWSTGK